RARRYQASIQQLLQLGSQPIEPLDIPEAAWPALQRAGWLSLRWDGNWYGQPVQGALGAPVAGLLKWRERSFTMHSGDEVQLNVHMAYGALGGESRLFTAQTGQVFLLLLETRLRERTGALSAALAERARLSLYVQHDMRNMAQWVSWVSTDFAQASNEAALLAAAKRLQENAPLALERATRLNIALGKSPQVDAARSMDLRMALEQAAQLAGLEITVEGSAAAWIAPAALARTLDNLLSNLAVHWREGHSGQPHAELREDIQANGGVAMSRLRLSCPTPAGGMQLATEKLFEPFASGRPGGLGLGLYQARKSLREAGGDLLAVRQGAYLQFDLLIPWK
ncbi:MAG: hypothetical protein H7Y28_13765, partial [Rhodoferax sp.]|nr:hypothetical protein [Rhodoferax sp.]